MAIELAKQYEAKEAQKKCLAFWTEKRFSHANVDSTKQPFTIVIPPPNVTGSLHLGHALNNTLQDILIRWRRMQGFNTLWMPGTDHAGIATQAVVERLIFAQEKKTRHDLGREALVSRIWEWKDKYEERILGQLREMGASCDWERTRFTLDPICAKAVRETFFKMFRDGYIFRGKRLVNWDTQLQTSVADDETYVENTKAGFWTFRYPVKGSEESIRFSTTRPETMLGDTALCVHPSDERYQHLIGKLVTIPLNNRDIPIVADGLLADPTLGTGCVKVTPAHDPNDYACYTRHPEIGLINILNPDGSINAEGGKFEGMDRYKAREAVVQEMESLGFFEGKEDRIVPLKFSDRSKSPIEPYLSDQWFIKMGDREDGKPGLAQLAMNAVLDGEVKFFPDRYAKTYLDWLGEKRDWCISRQLWWGHRITVWSKRFPIAEFDAKTFSPEKWDNHTCLQLLPSGDGTEQSVNICLADPELQAKTVTLLESLGFEQDESVLDTWFSSALWPHSTLGWPEETPELKHFYPTSTLVTSRDIITLWVARMVIMGQYNLGKVPFSEVYVHPKMLDGFGEGMSKSKGNGVDPLDIIETYGTDALRYAMCALATETQDSRMPVSNICPHCGVLVPVKQEHMYMRTKKLACSSCKQSFRPGGPWPTPDPELPTAKQASDRFELGRNFANKLWNASRFILLNLDGYDGKPVEGDLPLEDRWILSRLASTTEAITQSLTIYRFSEAARLLYEFVWSEFCDWYIELAKGRLKDEAARSGVQRVLIGVLDAIVRLVHPIMPFLAESLWEPMNQAAPNRGLLEIVTATESVMVAPWPTFPASLIDSTMETRIFRMQESIRAIREVRNRYQIEPRTPISAKIQATASVVEDFRSLQAFIKLLGGIEDLEIGSSLTKQPQSASIVFSEFEVYVSLQGLIDPAAEIKRLEKQIAERTKTLDAIKKKLENADFIARAPAEVVETQKATVIDLEKQIQFMSAMIEELK
jgi:valyl-tRNA synthetase